MDGGKNNTYGGYPGEWNCGIPCEACCSSETTRYYAHLCQLALNRANRMIEHAISGDIVLRSSVIECEIATKEVRNDVY